jgi:energy-coupling factor transporter ATP-binding protein EcfA2
MLKLTRLKLHKFPRVAPGTELSFNGGHNILLGINGSGKTTLLKLIARVVSGDFSDLNTASFDLEYDLVDGQNAYQIHVRHPHADDSGEDEPSETTLTCTREGLGPITFVHRLNTITEQQTAKIVSEALVSPLSLVPLGGQAALIFFERYGLQPHFPYIQVERMDEGTHWLTSVTDAAELDVIEPHTHRSGAPSRFKNLILQLLHGRPDRDVHVVESHDLPFLAQYAQILGFSAVSLQFELRRRERVEPHHNRWRYVFGDFRVRLTKPDGTRLTHHELSFGQQRLLGFFYYCAMHRDVIIADELCNGMHHAMIDRCLDEIGERQAFLATQNPLLLDSIGFADEEEVRRTFILCATTVEQDREQMTWRNMTSAEAAQFYRDYTVGISHVNEILRSWGLW